MNRQRLHNIAASIGLLGLALLWYGLVPYYQRYFSTHSIFLGNVITHWQLLKAFAAGYALILIAFYLLEPEPQVSKSVLALRALGRYAARFGETLRNGLPAEEKLGLLSILLKAFFAPLMIVWLFEHVVHMHTSALSFAENWAMPGHGAFWLFKTSGYWFLFQLILFLDVFFFTIGYLVDMRYLRNEIRSVDPTVFGWAVALACYPPFNGITSSVFGWRSSDHPQFDAPEIHVIANLALLTLMAIYSWASVALNFKASNLTHRGIVDTGPYRYVRHPAYVTKNLAWWIGLMPALVAAWNNSPTAAAAVIGSMVGWSSLYFLRAITEERHLRSVDGEYDDYCKRVRYRFIPWAV